VNNPGTASTPWLTVIIPSFRGERWIDASLRSIAAEPADGIEIFLVDGGPTPDTANIARTYSDRLRVTVFERPDLTSWQSKTNFAIEMSQSTHLCWLGVDDLWFPGRAAAAQRWIESAPAAPLHLAPSAIIDRDGRNLGIWRCPLPSETKLEWPFVNERLLIQNFVGAPAPVFRRDAWLACGGLDEALWYTADWDMWLKLAAHGPVHYHDAVTTALRIHGGSFTMTGSRNIGDFERQMQIVLDRHISGLFGCSKDVERAARASITVNAALAAASGGDFSGLARAAVAFFRLGPAGACRYLRDSRIMERVAPRIRAKLGGVF
jgi:glycosyltransferase involved in cell wall biosynthesis